VSGGVLCQDTGGAGAKVGYLSLPISTNFTSYSQLGGCANTDTTGGGNGVPAAMLADSTNDRAILTFRGTGSVNEYFMYTYTYLVA
jgi:hypothetical protein